MINFTKEELLTLEYCLDNFIPSICNDEWENRAIGVLNKIHSIIDNCCEHKFLESASNPK